MCKTGAGTGKPEHKTQDTRSKAYESKAVERV